MARIYIAGPMSGRPAHNIPAFVAAAERLRRDGHAVLSPVEKMTSDQIAKALTAGAAWTGTGDYKQLLADDIQWIATADAIKLLDGYEASKGAMAELAFAQAIGIEVRYPG